MLRRWRDRVSSGPDRALPERALAVPVRLPDERILEIAGQKLGQMGGEWVLGPGPLLKGPGTFAVRVGASDTDNPRHVDLEFLLNSGRADETSLIDCAQGYADDPEEAIREAMAVWADTTASVAFELVERQGRFATHYMPGEPGGFPGWHTIVGSIFGWALDAESAKQQWFADTAPWAELAPVITGGLSREALNGIRLFVGQRRGFEACEVKINGRLHEPSTAALAAMNWPRTEQMSTVKVFLLLIHPADAARLGEPA